MSGNRKLAGLLAVLFVGWGAVQLVLSRAGRTPTDEPESARAAARPGPTQQGIAATPGTASAEARVADGTVADDGAPATSPAPASAQGEGALAIQVEDSEDQPLEGIRLCVVLAGEEGRRELAFTELHQGDRNASIVTNFLGRATCFVPSGRAGALHAWSETGGLEPRSVAFAALAPFEERNLLVVLRRGLDAAIERTVVDGASGSPVPGAVVRVREEARTLGGTTTDEKGAFRAAWDSWREVHLRIDAQGYSPRLVSLEHDAAPEPIPLWRTASLELSATTARGTPFGGVHLEVHGRPAEALPARQRTPGLLAEDLVDGQAQPWLVHFRTDARGTRRPSASVVGGAFTSSTDAQGHALIDELPALVPLTIELWWDNGGGRSRLLIPPLEPGETRTLSWSLPTEQARARQAVRGRLVDQNDAPVAGQDMWLVSAEQGEGEGYLACAQPDHEATTEADGSFVIDGVPVGRYLLGPSPECRAPVASENANALAPWASVVELVAGVEPPLVLLQRPRELYVTCMVVDQHGDPRPAGVLAEKGDSVLSDAFLGEPLLLGPLMDEIHAISAFDHDSGGRSVRRSARPARGGGESLELVLRPENESVLGSLSGFVVDAESGDALVVLVRAIAAEHAGAALDPWRVPLLPLQRVDGPRTSRRAWQSSWSDGMGRFTIEELEPGAYVLLAEHGAALGLARALVPGPGDRVQDLLLRIPRPASLVVERSDSWSGDYSIRLEGLAVRSGSWSRGEPFEVPSGLLALEIDNQERTFFRTLDAPPGGTVAIELTDEGD